MGSYGSGLALSDGCATEAGTVRISFKIGSAWDESLSGNNFQEYSHVSLVMLDLANELLGADAVPPYYNTSFVYSVTGSGEDKYFTANVIYEDLEAAETALTLLQRQDVMQGNVDTPLVIHNVSLHYKADGSAGQMTVEPRPYAWTTGTTDQPLLIMPTGLDVDKVYFKSDCLSAGCWVVDITYTTGEDNFNVFYIPRSNNSDSSPPVDYDGTALDSTFRPANFPCGNDRYDPADSIALGHIPPAVSACCLPAFVDRYRPIADFNLVTQSLRDACPSRPPAMGWWNTPGSYLSGKFMDAAEMPLSHIDTTAIIDPFLGIYQASLFFDEAELRRYAGKLGGAVGVQHTVDTFIGLAEFKPTGLTYIDMATKQVEIHLEKTDFFSVATHGVNEYTFIEYVNLRLIEVYEQGADSIVGGEEDFARVDRSVRAQYVQVTFTMASYYSVKVDGMYENQLIPLDSVRVSKGGFLVESAMGHACLDYTMGDANDEIGISGADRASFDQLLAQDCGPQSEMCANPTSIPNRFVAFNIPLGLNWLPDPEATLGQQIFVSLVVQAENDEAVSGVQAGAAEITKTTLTASIPVVRGGVNIFCDAVVARTDLRDVVSALIIVGSAATQRELDRLRIFGEDGSLASSARDPRPPQRIDTDSIESALVTLVVQGNQSFFNPPPLPDGTRPDRDLYGVDLEDVVTLHIYEDPELYPAFEAPGSYGKAVLDLLRLPGEDRFDENNELLADGYALNGAFDLRVLRDDARARVDPSPALLTLCAFSATSPGVGELPPQSCVIRRDIAGKDNYPVATGAQVATAMELPHCADERCVATKPATSAPPGGGGAAEDVEEFMASVLGDSDYARGLGRGFSLVIAQQFRLNDAENRAWWVNPGYEWVPSLTARTSRFQLSQKLMLFALFNLNPARVGEAAGGGRRVLLAGEAEEGAGVSQLSVDFQVTPERMLASAVGLRADQVARFEVVAEVSVAAACMGEEALREHVRATLADCLQGAASWFATLQVLRVAVQRNGVHCLGGGPRRRADAPPGGEGGAMEGDEGGGGDAGSSRPPRGGAKLASEAAAGSAAPRGARRGLLVPVATVEVLVAFYAASPVFNRPNFLQCDAAEPLRDVRVTGAVLVHADPTFVPPPHPPDGDAPPTAVDAALATASWLTPGPRLYGACAAVVVVLWLGWVAWRRGQTVEVEHEAEVLGALCVGDLRAAARAEPETAEVLSV